jgi:outer membrane protein assembly factor BamB
VKRTYRPVFRSGTASVSTAPAVAGNLVITPFASANPGAVKAVALATGKEVWSGPDPIVGAAVAVSAGVAYIQAKDGNFYALDAATGREKWKTPLSATTRSACASAPVVRDGSIYLTGSTAEVTAPGSLPPFNYWLFAIDAATGQEQWRYHADAPYVGAGVCLRQPVVTSDAIFATGESRLFAIDRATGRDRWPSVEVRGMSEGRERPLELEGLVDAGDVVAGITPTALMAFSKSSGEVAWKLAGAYRTSAPATAVVDDVLYFQGSPEVKPTAASGGTLHALDLKTREILWSFSRPTPEPNWPFGRISVVDGAIWVDSYQALVKLQ